MLLTGALPFDGANDFEVIPKIRKGEFQQSPFLNGNNMHELITCMLNPDPKKRANLEDIQKHPWAWSDRSMIAMLVRPFANALAARRRILLGEDSDASGESDDQRKPLRRTTINKAVSAAVQESDQDTSASKRSSLKRQLSYFSDSELSGSSQRRVKDGRKRKLSNTTPVNKAVFKRDLSSPRRARGGGGGGSGGGVDYKDDDDDGDEDEGDEGGDEEQDLGDPSSPRIEPESGESEHGMRVMTRERRRTGGDIKEISSLLNSSSSSSDSDDDDTLQPKSSFRLGGSKESGATITNEVSLGSDIKDKPKKSGLPERASTKKKKARLRKKMLQEEAAASAKQNSINNINNSNSGSNSNNKKHQKGGKEKKVVRMTPQSSSELEEPETRPLRSLSVQERKPTIIMTAKESIKETPATTSSTETSKARIRSRSNSLPESEEGGGGKDKIAKSKKKGLARRESSEGASATGSGSGSGLGGSGSGSNNKKKAGSPKPSPPTTPNSGRKKSKRGSMQSSSSSSGADIIASESPKKKKKDKKEKRKKEKKHSSTTRRRSKSTAGESPPIMALNIPTATAHSTTTPNSTPPLSGSPSNSHAIPHSPPLSPTSMAKDQIDPTAPLRHKIQTRERRSYSTDEGMDRTKYTVLAKRSTAKKEKSLLSKKGKNGT